MVDRVPVILANLWSAKLRPWGLRSASRRRGLDRDKPDLATSPREVDGHDSTEFYSWSGSLLRGVLPDLMHGCAS